MQKVYHVQTSLNVFDPKISVRERVDFNQLTKCADECLTKFANHSDLDCIILCHPSTDTSKNLIGNNGRKKRDLLSYIVDLKQRLIKSYCKAGSGSGSSGGGDDGAEAAEPEE